MRALVCILLAALALTAPVLASAAQEELYGDLGMSAAESAAPEAARETLGDLGIMDAVEPEGMLSKLLDAALEGLRGYWREAAEAALKLVAVALLCTLAGAFADGALKGFASVESAPLGKAGDYRDLTCLHVSAELRGRGIGRELFTRAAQWARAHGGKKLYLSAHSAVETQAFYAAMGCVEAREYNEAHVASEPFDCQMEYAL